MTAPSPPTAGGPHGERRGGDRRHGDRRGRERRSARRPPSDTWFGAGRGGDSQWNDSQQDAAARAAASGAAFDWQQALRRTDAGPGAFERIDRVYLGARAVLALVLLATAAAYGVLGATSSDAVLAVCALYAALAVGLWLLPRFRDAGTPGAMARLASPRWLATIGVDAVCFLALYALAAGSGLNPLPLLVLPVLMAGLLSPRRLALATAAAVTLALLGLAWAAVLAGGQPTVLLTQAGFAGGGLFVTAVLAGEVAQRLAREELAARGSLEAARHQAQLNRLVIQEMTDGVLVIDREGRVRAANPAARALLVADGLAPEAPFSLRRRRVWHGLVTAVEQAFAGPAWPQAGHDVVLDFDGGVSRTLRLRVRFARRPGRPASEEFCVLFLEDVRSVQARTRQEKLAAMGRVSAGIAHEIRNPLAAIAQANALLAEDLQAPEHRQLTRMVADNVERLKRIVDDVMEVAPVSGDAAHVIDARAQTLAATAEWARTAGVALAEPGADDAQAGNALVRLEVPAEPIGVVFDEEHLRRVLVNLLDNARRHCSGTPGAVKLTLHGRDAHQAILSVASDGAPVEPDVERFLFEPFFSTRSRGTGLGLYICRELCERYGASIAFRLRPQTERLRNEFVIALRRQAPDG